MAKKRLKSGVRTTRLKRGDVSLPAMGGGKLRASEWDMGPATLAQSYLKVVEDASWTDPDTGKKINPNGVKRARRIDLFEHYARIGKLEPRCIEAGRKLRTAWEATQRSAPAIKKVQVDSSPKPDQHIAVQIDRFSKYHNMMRLVDTKDIQIIDCVVLCNRGIHHLGYRGRHHAKGVALLGEALGRLADKLNL